MKSASLLVAACGLALMSTGCAPVDLEGSWSGSWRTTLNIDNGSMTMDLSQDDDAISGSFNLTGTTCVGSGSVDGTVDNRNFTASLNNGVGGELTIDTTVAAGGDKFDGTFDVTGGFCQDASGKLDLSRD